MPRVLQLLALVLAFTVSGAPAWIAEIIEDDCVEKCVDEPSGCPDEGCADCALICSSCPRTHVLVPPSIAQLMPVSVAFAWISSDAGERVPVGPPPEGVFHPPRLAG